MWTQASAPLLLLLLACWPWSAEAQSHNIRGQSIWADPIKFTTKANELCTMGITGQGEYTRLRLSCQSIKRSYWCEYVGKPYACRSYNKNPRHYFVQMMWSLRKLYNACEAPRHIKPHMCRRATDDSQMVFSSASFSRSWTEAPSRAGEAPARPQPRPNRPDSSRKSSTRVPAREKTTQRSPARSLTPPVQSGAKGLAQQYCWRSLQGICSYMIGLFQN